MDKFIVASGCAISVHECGTGDNAILLLHGYLESSQVWDDFSRLLSKNFRVVAIDLPGHGISQVMGPVHTMAFLADVAADAMRVLGIDRYAVVGHSMGGYVALEMMRRASEHLTGVVLFHSTPNADTEEKRANREREIEIVNSGKKELLARTLPSMGFAEQNRRRLRDHIESLGEQIFLTEEDGIVAILRGMMEREDLNEMMASSKLPQMMIFGRQDSYITPEAAEAVVAHQPQAQVVWLEESAHNGFVEQPEKSAEAIQFFLAEKR